MCFKWGRCDHAKPIPKDGCCAHTEGDRTIDSDCMTADIDLKAVGVATPAATKEGDIFVTTSVEGEDGLKTIKLWLINKDGVVHPPKVIGKAERLLPPIISQERSIYVAFGQGVLRYDLATMGEEANIPSDQPVGAIVTTGGNPRGIVGWFTKNSKLLLYSEDEGKSYLYSIGEWHGEAYAPVVFADGSRMAGISSGGEVLIVSLDSTPVGPIAFGVTGLLPNSSPVESGGKVFFTTIGGYLVAMKQIGSEVKEAWRLELNHPPNGKLLVDGLGRIWVTHTDGFVLVVRDGETTGYVSHVISMGKHILNNVSPILTSTYRFIAFVETEVSIEVVTMIRKQLEGEWVWVKGLSFDVGVRPSGSPTLVKNRLIFGSQKGRLLYYVLSEEIAKEGYVKDGGDMANSCRVGKKR